MNYYHYTQKCILIQQFKYVFSLLFLNQALLTIPTHLLNIKITSVEFSYKRNVYMHYFMYIYL